MAREQISDDKLIEIIVDGCELGKERWEQCPRTDLFVDSRNTMWKRTLLVPITDGHHRILWISDFASSDDVFIYGVPCERPEHYGFVRVAVQRHGAQIAKDKIGIAATVKVMSLATFQRELGEDLWSAWVETMGRKESREGADEMKACLEEVLGILKDEGIVPDPAILDKVRGTVQACLDSVDGPGDDGEQESSEPPPPAPPQ